MLWQVWLHDLLDPHWPASLVDDFVEFASLGLFPAGRRPVHPSTSAFNESVVYGNDVILTTGTGSGKTECFFLPIVATLVRESANWPTPAPGVPSGTGGGISRYRAIAEIGLLGLASATRLHCRTGAIRALILYPLNALVEDQLGRLRDAVDCSPRMDGLTGTGMGTGCTLVAISGEPQFPAFKTSANARNYEKNCVRLMRMHNWCVTPRQRGSFRAWMAARCGPDGICRKARQIFS